MKKIRFLVLLVIFVSILASNIVVSANTIGSNVHGNEDKGCVHTYEIDSREEFHGDYNGKCKVSIIDFARCKLCGYSYDIDVTVVLRKHESLVFKAVCDRATHIYYCKCKCGKGMPTIREACPRPGIGCPDMLSLGRGINVIY